MVQTILTIDEVLNKEIEIYQAKERIETKPDAIIHILKSFFKLNKKEEKK